VQVVLLAAGLGSRLGTLTRDIPKALVSVAGKPLVFHALEFAARLRPAQILVVGGYGFPLVARALDQGQASNPTLAGLPIKLVENTSFRDGNLISLLAARAHVTDGFVLLNVDHIYRPSIAEVVAPDVADVTAFIDTDRKLGLDDMKNRAPARRPCPPHCQDADQFRCGLRGHDPRAHLRAAPVLADGRRGPGRRGTRDSRRARLWADWPRIRRLPCVETSVAAAGWRSTPPRSARPPSRPCWRRRSKTRSWGPRDSFGLSGRPSSLACPNDRPLWPVQNRGRVTKSKAMVSATWVIRRDPPINSLPFREPVVSVRAVAAHRDPRGTRQRCGWG